MNNREDIRKHTMQILTIAGLLLSGCSYLPADYDRGTFTNIREETADYILLASSDEMPSKALMFVPGGFVDPHVYLCWMNQFVADHPGIAIIQLKIASNLAIVNQGKVNDLMDHFETVDRWVIGGHSLGGVVSVFTVANEPGNFDGLILMAAWATESSSLEGWSGTVLSFYGSNDGLATVDEVDQNKSFLPPGQELFLTDTIVKSVNHTYYYMIEGGNHSGFGCYGFQEGDGEAEISAEQQQDEILTVLDKYLAAIWE